MPRAWLGSLGIGFARREVETLSTGVGEVQELRERLARFTDAALRINESLDLDVVLQGVLDSARELTGGRYALLSLVDSSGELQECLTSGMTDKGVRRVLARDARPLGAL